MIEEESDLWGLIYKVTNPIHECFDLITYSSVIHCLLSSILYRLHVCIVCIFVCVCVCG